MGYKMGHKMGYNTPMLKNLDQYLKRRGDRWYYVRRVPGRVGTLDQRGIVKTALKTSSLEVARARRDALAEADDHYWASLLATIDADHPNPNSSENAVALSAYKSAKLRAMARGFVYRPAEELISKAPTEELVNRLKHVGAISRYDEQETQAVLGTVQSAAPPLSQALETYFEFIAAGKLLNKSDAQKETYFKPKRRAVANFIKLFGDLGMDEIDRTHGREFHAWWSKRLKPTKKGVKPLSADSANRDIGNLRNLFKEYWAYEGDEKRENPFRSLRFSDVTYKEIPPFSNEWVRTKILLPGLFDDINREAALIIYAMIETGCRPSELANLTPVNIKLGHNVPHIQIRQRVDRKLKSSSSVRDVPLVGVALEAMRRAPEGFPHFQDKGNLLSASLMKAFRARRLFETEEHRIYSFRHSFEKRMLEADVDYGLRCLLMGHTNSRPSYGDGGSLEFRRTQLERIMHPVSAKLGAAIANI